MSNFRK